MELATQNGASTGTKVQLGQHSYEAYAQRHAYLMNRLGKAIGALSESGALDASGFEEMVGSLGYRSYDLLSVFYPKLMPAYEFSGYATAEAMESGDYNEEYDHSPTFPEIVRAFEVALVVNRLDLLKSLGKVINTDLIRAYMTKMMADFFEEQQRSSSVTTSPSTSSGASSPTLTANTA